MKIVKLATALLIILEFACSTDTGNPALHSGIPVSSTSPITDQVAYAICSKIRDCFNPYLTNCESKIRTAAHLPTDLGLNETTYPNLNAIQSAANELTLRVDGQKRDACFQSLKQVTCADSHVQQSYDSAMLENLNQAGKLLAIDSNCSQFFY